MHSSNRNNTLPVIHMIHSSYEVCLNFSVVPSVFASDFALMDDTAMTYVIEPSTTKTLPEDYVERVKQIHESGGHGSRGYAII